MDVNNLRQHEEISLEHFTDLLGEIKKNKYIEPILVESRSRVILDGHHRYNVIKSLGFSSIPAYKVSYSEVELKSWRPDIKVTKKEVIRRGKEGDLFPPKTSRHIHGFEKEKISLEALK